MKTFLTGQRLLALAALCLSALCSPSLAAPTVSLSAPANGTSYLAPASIALSASATPSSGTTIKKVEFYRGSTLIGSDTTSPYSATWSNAAAGSYSLTAKATDSAGGVTTSAAVSVTVHASNSPPTVSLTAPGDGASYTRPATLTLSADASGIEANTAITKVEFYAGTTLIGSDTTSPYSVNWTPAAAGTFNLTAKATDSAGGVTTSAARSVTINDKLLLSVSKTGNGTGSVSSTPAGISCGATCSGSFTAGTVVTLSASPAAGSVFSGWGGACSGSGACVVTLSAARNVSATFALAQGSSMIIDGPATAVNLSAGQSGRYTFVGTAGQSLGLGILGSTTPADSVIHFAINKPDGRELTSYHTRGTPLTWAFPTLPASGTYTLVVNPEGGITGLNLLLSTNATGVLTENGPALTFNLTRVGQNANYTFSGTTGQSLNLQISGDTIQYATYISVVQPNGQLLKQTWVSYGIGEPSVGTLVLDNLPATGNFTVNVYPQPYAESGSITLALTHALALSVSKAGNGTGSVSSTPAGISCGATCSGSFTAGTVVTLSASPAAGSVFSGWGGACSGSGACVVTLSAARNVSATFTLAQGSSTTHLSASPNPSTAGSPVVFTASVSGVNPTGSVSFTDNGIALSCAAVPLTGTGNSRSATCSSNSLSVGTHSIVAAYAGDACNSASTSAAWTQTVNAGSLPTVSLTAPADGAVYARPVTVTLNASAAAGSAGTTISKVEFYAGTTLIGSDTTSPYSVSWTPVTAGTFNLTAKATDSAGGVTTSAARSVTINASNTAPTVSLTAPADNAHYLAPATVSLSASASDVELNTPISKVEFYQGSTLLGSSTASPYAFTWNNVAAGTYRLTAKATDSAGASSTSAAKSIVVEAGSAAAGLYFIQVDHLETPRLISDANGQTVWRWENTEAFGYNPPDEDPDGDGRRLEFNQRFPGQYFDRETGLSYNYYRDYDPSTGRYVESDPIGLAGGVNTYAYVGGSPISFIDPRGLDRWGDDPSLKWIPADPQRTAKYICDGLKSGGYIDRDEQPYDLSWRDAEHFLYSYTAMRDGLPGLWIASGPYQIARSYGYSAAKSVGFFPEASPPSLGEANAGAAGVFQGIGAHFSPKASASTMCECQK